MGLFELKWESVVDILSKGLIKVPKVEKVYISNTVFNLFVSFDEN